MKPIQLLIAIGLGAGIVCPALPAPTLEYRVKAAFLLNFTKFVEWPETAFSSPRAPISICIVGEDPFGPEIDGIVAEETVNARRLEVRRVASPEATSGCHVVYIEGARRGVLQTVMSSGQSVLTVGEGDEFLRVGGMIAFVIENRRVRFDIDQRAAERNGLRLNAKLLSVARMVHQ